MKLEERDQLADFQVALVPPAKLGQELIERERPPKRCWIASPSTTASIDASPRSAKNRVSGLDRRHRVDTQRLAKYTPQIGEDRGLGRERAHGCTTSSPRVHAQM